VQPNRFSPSGFTNFCGTTVSEVHEFAGAAAAAEAVGPVGDHEVDVITQALFVETPILLEGRDERRKETAEGIHRRR